MRKNGSDSKKVCRQVLADAIVAGAGRSVMVSMPDEPGDDGQWSVTVWRLAEQLGRDRGVLPPAARQALGLQEGARFADAVQVLRTRWEEDTASKPDSAALQRVADELAGLIRDVRALKPRLKVAAGRLAAAAATAVPVEIADDGTKYTVERWVSEALTSTLGGSVSEALDEVVDRLAYMQDFDTMKQNIHDFQ